MAVKGVFASHQNIVGARKGDFASGLLQTQPTGSAPMLALSSGMASRGLGDTVATWFEEDHLTGTINITNNAGTGVTLTLNDVTQVVANQVFLIHATGEYVFVEGISGSNATVTRGFGGTSIQAVDGSGTPKPMQRIGTAFEEGSAKPTAFANLGFPRFNYSQTFRNAWDVTGTAAAVQFHTGDVVAKNKADAALFHAEDIERSTVWGVKAIGTLNSKPFRTMDGIQKQLSTNLSSQATNVAWADDIRPFLEGIFAVNIKGQPNERISFCGNTVVGVFEDIARKDATINIMPGQTDYGFNIRKLMTPFGDVTLMTHPLFSENAVFTKDWLVIHPGAVEYRWLRRTFADDYDRDGSRAGADADYGVITSELCVTYKAQKTGGYFDGIDTAAASS
jgi:hypothetical protein